MTGARTGSRVARIAPLGFWPAFRKTQPARQRRPYPTVVPLRPAVVPSHPAVVPLHPRSPLRGACFWPPSAAADQKVRAPSARSLPCCGSLQQLAGSVGSASARSEIVSVAVESIARPAAYRWVRGPSGPLSGRHSRRVSAVHTPRSYRCTPRSPLRGACFWPPSAAADQKVRAPSARSLPCCGSLQHFGRFGGERIGPQRDRVGGSREHRQAGGVSLGARAFWPAFRKTQPARQRRPYPTVVRSHPAVAASRRGVLAAFGGSGPEGPRTQRAVVALLWFSTAVGRSVGSASARSEIVSVAVESIARPAAYRWVRGAAIRAPDDGRTDWFTGGADRATRVLARFLEDTAGASAPSIPHGRTVAVVPLHPTVAASRRVFLAAFGGSGPEGPRTQRTVVAVLWFSTALWQVRWGAHRPAARSCRWQ